MATQNSFQQLSPVASKKSKESSIMKSEDFDSSEEEEERESFYDNPLRIDPEKKRSKAATNALVVTIQNKIKESLGNEKGDEAARKKILEVRIDFNANVNFKL